jgi:hypothetical protein
VLWAVSAPSAARFAVSLGIAILLGMEAGSLRRWTLTRRGYRNVGVVVGDDLDTAERRFFSAWTEEEQARPAPAPSASAPSVAPPPIRMSHAASGIIGLFPEPGARR